MKIIKFQQSGLIVEADNGYRLAIDIGAYTPLEQLDGVTADAMLVSHLHGDHFTPAQIKKLAPKKVFLNQECIDLLDEEGLPSSEITKVQIGDSIDIDAFHVQFFDVDHGPNVSVRPKENFGFLIEVDGKKIYFGGDIFYPSGLDVSTLEVDYALLPIGTFYTFGPAEAAAFASQFKRIGTVVPMHYANKPETLDEFTKIATVAGHRVESLS